MTFADRNLVFHVVGAEKGRGEGGFLLLCSHSLFMVMSDRCQFFNEGMCVQQVGEQSPDEGGNSAFTPMNMNSSRSK